MTVFLKRIQAFIIAFIVSIGNLMVCMPEGWIMNDYSFSVDASEPGRIIQNPVSNINVWEMGTQFIDAKPNYDNNIFDFVEYVQLMQCTGGNAQRDLFIDPYDTSVMDDYDFTRLVENCRGLLALGAKPHLKLGNVPMKYTKDCNMGYFGVNVYPPDDYEQYYDYIYALAKTLVDEFGREEVLTWRFGVLTEYENSDWFMAKSGDPAESAEAYCKLYDYTAQALIDAVGQNVYISAHSMSVTEGLWDEAYFIRHCAQGTNYKTGKTGSPISGLSISFYDVRPGEFTTGSTFPEAIAYIRGVAESVGLNDLVYGVDEGRILYGVTPGRDAGDLPTRLVGYTYQAAYDARLMKQAIDNDVDYFSSWGYLSGGLFSGNPSVSYHVAKHVHELAGCKLADTQATGRGFIRNAEVDAVSGYDTATNTLHVMAYNFKNSLSYKNNADVHFSVKAPQLGNGKVRVTAYVVDDDCNYFDEWVEDRKTYGIGDDCFAWSPDDCAILPDDARAQKIYREELFDKYTECARLIPETNLVSVENGEIRLDGTLKPNTVVFYKITKA